MQRKDPLCCFARIVLAFVIQAELQMSSFRNPTMYSVTLTNVFTNKLLYLAEDLC